MTTDPYLKCNDPGIKHFILRDLIVEEKGKNAIQSASFDTVKKSADS